MVCNYGLGQVDDQCAQVCPTVLKCVLVGESPNTSRNDMEKHLQGKESEESGTLDQPREEGKTAVVIVRLAKETSKS